MRPPGREDITSLDRRRQGEEQPRVQRRRGLTRHELHGGHQPTEHDDHGARADDQRDAALVACVSTDEVHVTPRCYSFLMMLVDLRLTLFATLPPDRNDTTLPKSWYW